MRKNELYDELCGLLTEYEMFGEDGYDTAVEAVDLYTMLVKIQNNWEELTSTDE